ncbi:hypothetical protein CAOG_003469 [Capsaspora owczarzaki ATCC 30864]|uniref:Uncharacterized protein n=1 Tax=Capsaspora owczarzaki (strain ATCC 30864) TaxID=595528 RepID=A0A0D2UBW5_CAPO3|nr:hypothetical protein CAOG_003469 [Capsaspora owczarzaki ATCC 30864]
MADEEPKPLGHSQLPKSLGKSSEMLAHSTHHARNGSDATEILAGLPVARTGVLHKKNDVAAGKKAAKRDWKQHFVVLQGHLLLCYKDEAESKLGKMPDAEDLISIKSCICDIAYDYTKRKNVFRLRAFNGAEYLLEAQDNDDMLDWIKKIHDNNNPDADSESEHDLIRRKAAEQGLQSRKPHEPTTGSNLAASAALSASNASLSGAGATGAKKTDGKGTLDKKHEKEEKRFQEKEEKRLDKEHKEQAKERERVEKEEKRLEKEREKLAEKERKKTEKEKFATLKKAGTSNAASAAGSPHSPGGGSLSAATGLGTQSKKTSGLRKKVGALFNKKEDTGSASPAPSCEFATFGVALDEHLEFQDRLIPLIVERCIQAVEKRGMDAVGIYRLSANASMVQALKEAFERDPFSVNLDEERWDDIHGVTGVLKLYLRELPEALVTHALYDKFIDAARISQYNDRLYAIKDLVNELPAAHFATLQFIAAHLHRVAERSEQNLMAVNNLAIVFGPTIVRPAEENAMSMLNDMSFQCSLVETMISQCDWVFEKLSDDVTAGGEGDADKSAADEQTETSEGATEASDDAVYEDIPDLPASGDQAEEQSAEQSEPQGEEDVGESADGLAEAAEVSEQEQQPEEAENADAAVESTQDAVESTDDAVESTEDALPSEEQAASDEVLEG